MNNYYCIIMAGGIGRRFWPYSRKALPKQFLDFFGTGQTLLQQTYDRYKQIIPRSNIFITTYKSYRNLVLESIPELDEKQLIIEDERRNTAPSIAYATYIIQKMDPDATVVVAPSDHLILKNDLFNEAILKGLDFASKNDKLVTLGIKPNRPETGYGYIQIAEEEKEEDFYKVKTFIEKPAREFAEIFVQSNEFYWNSGIFVWNVKTIQNAFHQIMSEICPRVECDNPDFSACPNISIDYSIMEKANNAYVQLCDFGWTDLGTWEALYDTSPKDENENVTNSNALLYNCKNNIVSIPEDHLAVIQGLDGYLVAARGNALLICKKDDQDAIRKFVNDVEMKFGEKYS